MGRRQGDTGRKPCVSRAQKRVMAVVVPGPAMAAFAWSVPRELEPMAFNAMLPDLTKRPLNPDAKATRLEAFDAAADNIEPM